VHSVDAETSPVTAMTHHVFLVGDAATKRQVVRELAGGTSRRLLFTRTKHQARKLARDLTADGVPAVELHGNLSQNARTRNLAAFSDGTASVMVATDIAARGIHVDDVNLVVHADPPVEHKAYLHRSGRTARAGNEGTVVTLMHDAQVSDVRDLTRKAGIKPTITRFRGATHPVLQEIAPGVRKFGNPVVFDTPAPQQQRPRNRGNGDGRSASNPHAGNRGQRGNRSRGGQRGGGQPRTHTSSSTHTGGSRGR
jgi:superfamily II DNA/RNA helicase